MNSLRELFAENPMEKVGNTGYDRYIAKALTLMGELVRPQPRGDGEAEWYHVIYVPAFSF